MISLPRSKRVAGYAVYSIAAVSVLFLVMVLETEFTSQGNESDLVEISTDGEPTQLSSPTTPPAQLGQYRQYTQYGAPIGVQLVPGAASYYAPRVQPIGPPVIDGNPMGIWGDIFQRVTSELATDTAEVANLDRQVILSVHLRLN